MAGLGLRLHDNLYGGNLLGAFDTWWEYAREHYVPMDGDLLGDAFTMYYDPIIDRHHRVSLRDDGSEAGSWANNDKLLMALGLTPLRPDVARLFYESAAESLNWRGADPVREPPGNPRTTLYGMVLAREFGDAAVCAKLAEHSDAHHGPAMDAETAEFTWAFDLDEPHPRGQLNASAAMAEASGDGAWWRLYNEPNLQKFVDPTVHGVDFPTVCLSQATYDVARRALVVATDAGVPAAAGKPTSFRVSNIDPATCTVIADGDASDAWRVVDNGDLEIDTTVGAHTFLIRQGG